MASKKKHKRKKYVPAYIAMYSVLFVIILLLIIFICSITDCGGNGETGGTAETTPGNSKPPPVSTSSPITDVTQTETLPETTKTPVNEGDNWALYVIGNDNPLPEDFSVETKAVVGERHLDKRCADHAIQMLKDAAEQNVGLYVTSSYRSIQKQAENLESYINTLMAQGYTKEQATIQAHKEIALPGHSEHNAGLAMDIVSDNYWSTHTDLDESFDKLPQYDWLIANSWKYGFILSYPKGKEDITGFIYEPWHYRFVGLEHAKKIHEVYEQTGEFLTVNEYIEKYM